MTIYARICKFLYLFESNTVLTFSSTRRNSNVDALGLTGSEGKAGPCPNKMLALYKITRCGCITVVGCDGTRRLAFTEDSVHCTV
jgi:hypothetical protein